MDSHELAARLQATAAALIQRPSFTIPEYHAKEITFYYWCGEGDEKAFYQAVKALGPGEKSYSDPTAPYTGDYAYYTAHSVPHLKLQVDRSKVCKIVEPAKPAVYDCDSWMEKLPAEPDPNEQAEIDAAAGASEAEAAAHAAAQVPNPERINDEDIPF